MLQEGEFERVGEERTRRVDVRIIGATNRNLKQEVEEKRFRQDLFYRLNVFPIEVAPLRERVEDIPLLVECFLREMIKKNKRSCQEFSPAQMIQLQQYHWPGNIRELQNVVERAVITCQSGKITLDIPFHTQHTETGSAESHASEDQDRVLTNLELKKIEKKNIFTTLQQTGWKIYGTGGAADLIGLKPTTLVSKIKKYNIKK